MQRSTLNNQVELIRPAAYARLRNLNRSTISRQIASGAIPSHGGLLDIAEADLARANNLRDGQRRKPIVPVGGDGTSGKDFTDGAAWLAHHVCTHLRTTLPELLRDWQPGTFPDEDPETRKMRLGVGISSLVSYLVEGWYEELLVRAQPFPPVPWKRLYGKRAKEAREWFEELHKYWASDGESDLPPAA